MEYDDFEETHIYNNTPCNKLYIRIPGEHEIDGVKPDMELQLKCEGKLPFDTYTNRISYISIPIQVDNDKGDNHFFKETFNDVISIGQKYYFNGLDNILNKFISVFGLFYYAGTNNFPECNPDHQWIVLHKQKVYISSNTLQKFKDLLDKSNTPNGNRRNPSDPAVDIKLLYFGK